MQASKGALPEVNDMLNRMVEMATQWPPACKKPPTASGTYDDDTNRANLQAELEQPTDEIDRIVDSASFNGIDLLDSTATNLKLRIADTPNSFKQLTAAISTIKGVINYVSSIHGNLGAIQNCLEHTVNNLSVMEENIQTAASHIHETDIADEMMSYTENNILVQSVQAMLAQANAVTRGVLQLLQQLRIVPKILPYYFGGGGLVGPLFSKKG